MRSQSPLPFRASDNGVVLFRVLGSLEVTAAGTTASVVKSQRLRRLLGALLIRLGQTITADRLADAVWPDDRPVDPRAALYSLAYRLRRVVDALPGVELRTTPPGYALLAARDTVDALRFEDLVSAARRAPEPERTAELLDAALALWRGPAYAEFTEEDFARAEAARLAALHSSAMTHRAEAALDLERYDEAVARLEPILATDLLDERPWRAMMIALHRLGRAADALRTYRRYRELSAAELGLEPSTQLKQVEMAILRGEGGAAGSAGARRSRRAPAVALPPTSFVGRTDDLAAVERMLAEARLVTIVGTGGVGKTRLAIEASRVVGRRFPDGVLVCELAGVSDHEQVLAALAAAADTVPEADVPVVQQVVAALAHRACLIVLDNCEHVIDEVSSVVDGLLAADGSVRVLATSRERLGVPGEHVWPLDCLPVPRDGEAESPSVHLFLDRAMATNPRFSHDPGVVAEICRRLEGLPLAIELAAARTSGLAAGDILARLDQPELLEGARPGAARRHTSLTAVVAWSYELLDSATRDVFDRLAVFPGDFGLDAAAAVGDPEMTAERVTRAVVALAERSMVRHVEIDGRSRYRMLDVLRRYGHQRLRERGVFADVRARHARWALAAAEAASPGHRGFDEVWQRRIDHLLPDLRAAHAFHIASGDTDAALRMTAAMDCYALASLRPEVYGWAADALALPHAGEHPLSSAAHASRAVGAWLGGDLAGARAHAEAAMAATGAQPGGPHHAAVGALAAVSALERDFGTASRLYRAAVDAAEAAGAHPLALLYSVLEASVLVHSGVPEAAADAVARAHASGSPHLQALAHMVEAEQVLPTRPDLALAQYWRAVDAAERSGSAYLLHASSMSAALCEAAHGDESRSVDAYRRLLHRWRGRLTDTDAVRVLRGVTALLVVAGEFREAVVLSGAVDHCRELSYTVPEFDRIIDRALARACAALGSDHARTAAAEGRELDRGSAMARAIAALDRIGPRRDA